MKPKKNYDPRLNSRGLPKNPDPFPEPTTPRGKRRRQKRQGG